MNLIAGITTKNEDWIVLKTLSVLTQFCNKIIVYDDGSTDKTEEICRSFDKVVWRVRHKHDPIQREEAKQRLELINLLKDYKPDYALLLDADEIPTPSIVNFLSNIDSSVNLWGTRMINLWNDETKYRCDSYTTAFGTNVNWDPFSSNPWTKYPLMKFDKSIDYSYDLSVQKGGCSRYHPAPGNIADPVHKTDDFYIIHYGKLSKDYLSGDKTDFYSKIESKTGLGDYNSRIRWHNEHNRIDSMFIKEVDKSWIWSL
jgi:glycosyltransferase involved in cell wall biosynthesis